MHKIEDSHLKFLFTDDIYIIPEMKEEMTKSFTEQAITELPIVKTKEPPLTIIQEKPAEVNIPKNISPEFDFIGGNQKNILFINAEKKKEIITSSEKNFLLKILQAVSLSLEDVAIIHFDKEIDFKDLQRQFKFNTIVFLGLAPEVLKAELKTTLYHPDEKLKLKILYTHKLSEIEADIEKKKLLWKSLQTLFLSK